MGRSVFRGIAIATLILASMHAASKLLGLGREILLARSLGLAGEMDAFLVAYNCITLPVNTLFGVAPAAFVPALIRLSSEEGRSSAGRLSRGLVMTTFLLGSLMALMLWLLPGRWLGVMVPGMSSQGLAHLGLMFQWLLPLVPLMGTALVLGAILTSEEHFMVPAAVPLLTSLGGILALWLWPESGVWSLVWALILGSLAECALLFYVVRRRGLWEAGKVPWKAVRGVVSEYIPMISGGILMNSTLLVDFGVASLLPAGGIAALSFANRLPQAVGMLGAQALSTAVLPFLSRLVVAADWSGIRRVMRLYAGWGLVALGIVAGTATLFSEVLIRLLFERGAFGSSETALVAGVQKIYFLQIPFMVAGMVFVRLASALGRNKVLFVGAVVSAGLNLGMDLLLLPWLGLRAIAVSTVLVQATTFGLLGTWAVLAVRRREMTP